MNEVRQQGAHAPNCYVIECDVYSERRLLSTRTTQHMYVRDGSERLFIEMSLMKDSKAECANCLRAHSMVIKVCETSVLSGSRAHSSIPKSRSEPCLIQFEHLTCARLCIVPFLVVCLFVTFTPGYKASGLPRLKLPCLKQFRASASVCSWQDVSTNVIRDTKLLWPTTHKRSSTLKSAKVNSCLCNQLEGGTRRVQAMLGLRTSLRRYQETPVEQVGGTRFHSR